MGAVGGVDVWSVSGGCICRDDAGGAAGDSQYVWYEFDAGGGAVDGVEHCGERGADFDGSHASGEDAAVVFAIGDSGIGGTLFDGVGSG